MSSAVAVHANDDAAAAPGVQSSRLRQDAVPDFFFGEPRGWVALRGGWLFPRAGGDLFTFVSDQLTLDRSDFRAYTFGGEVGVMANRRLALEGAVELSRRGVGSEYRRFVSSNAEPIAQTTRLDQTGVSVGVRFTPIGFGRRISQYAYIPRRVTPYAGGGLNIGTYTFTQEGRFVDFVDRSIFSDVFESSGWTVGRYARGGLDLQVWRRLYLNVDARYTWLHSDLSGDFTGFDGIDLAGFRGATGISVVF